VSEQVPTPTPTPPHERAETAALAVGGGGIATFALGWLVGSRLLRLLGLLAAFAGAGLYARERLAERGEKIDEAESKVQSALDDLDPVARAQVLADIAKSQI
jgi:hypothetical protein